MSSPFLHWMTRAAFSPTGFLALPGQSPRPLPTIHSLHCSRVSFLKCTPGCATLLHRELQASRPLLTMTTRLHLLAFLSPHPSAHLIALGLCCSYCLNPLPQCLQPLSSLLSQAAFWMAPKRYKVHSMFFLCNHSTNYTL